MSAPVAAELVAELHAEVRRFRSAKQALLWFRAARARKMPHAASLEPGSASKSSASRAVTYARIAKCLGPWHDVDAERDEPLAASALSRGLARNDPEAIAEADRRVAELVTHMVPWDKRSFLPDQLGFDSEQQTSAYVSYAERVIWRRLRAEGLLGCGECTACAIGGVCDG